MRDHHMSETTEFRTDDRATMENGDDHPGSDPQADIRARIAEKYEHARLDEMREQHEAHGLPAPQVDLGDEPQEPVATHTEDPVEESSLPSTSMEVAAQGELTPSEPSPPTPTAAPQPVQPQYIPMMLPDGRQTYVTPEQYNQLAAHGMAALARSQSPAQAQQPQPHTPPAPQAPTLDGDRAGSIAQRLSFGTVDEQKQALMDLADSLRPQERVDVEAIRRQAAADALQHMRLEQNLNAIGREYPEIFQDQVLSQLTALQLDALRRNSPQFQYLSDLDQYREACNLVRQRIMPAAAPQPQPTVQQRQPAPQAAPTVASRQATLERKRAAPSIPTAADRRMAADDDSSPTRAPTPAEIIASMQKSRTIKGSKVI